MEEEWFILIVGVLLGCVLGAVIIGIAEVAPTRAEVRELGQAICQEEYGLDFANYSSKAGLQCKTPHRVRENMYDGVKVGFVALDDKPLNPELSEEYQDWIQRMDDCFITLKENNIDLSNDTHPWRVEWENRCCYFVEDYWGEGDNTSLVTTGRCFE